MKRRRRANKEEGGTTKRVFAGLLTAALLLGLLIVGASAAETKYEPLTLVNSFATVTIDKARVIERPEDKTFDIFYGVPADAEVMVTITGAQEDFDLYIGAGFDQGEVMKDGSVLGKGSAECVLNADNVLQRVYLDGENGNTLEEDNSWVGNSEYIRQNGTYSFSLAAAEYVGSYMSLLCDRAGWSGPSSTRRTLRMSPLSQRPDDEEHWIGLIVEKAVGAASSIAPGTGAFTDVAEDSYCYDEVQWAVKKGITAGKTATTFAPGETCTKGQILTFLWRANGQPEPSAANPFTDVTESNYYDKAALWAAEQGLVSGSVFGASAPCTRAMTVTYLWTLAGKPAPEKDAAFTDVAPGAAYAKAVAWAVEKGITSGKTADTFAPDAACTRGQIATFLYRAMQ